ncbi:hypothetical protein [Comamonas sp. GB3 AK4-5]|uniref:hypothetical protein n=1 Tax=Comamonas sp. GB3 AK4-5 TaxID=3231487 RepID=UPI00351F44AA
MQIPPVDRNPIQWNTQGANLYSTGASGPAPIRPVNQVNAVESTDKIGEGAQAKGPDRPTDKDARNLDWTQRADKQQAEVQKAKEEEAQKEPISKMLIEHIQSLWRASAMAVEASQEAHQKEQGQEVHQKVQPARAASERLTYEDVAVKRTSGL